MLRRITSSKAIQFFVGVHGRRFSNEAMIYDARKERKWQKHYAKSYITIDEEEVTLN